MARRRRLVKILVALALLGGVALLFIRSVRDSRGQPYTVERAHLRGWTVVAQPASGPHAPALLLRPSADLPSGLFRQIFARAMESLASPSGAGIPLVLQAELEGPLAAHHLTLDALVALARDAGLESETIEPRCLGYRRESTPGLTRQLYFALFDAPAFGRFRQRVAALAGGGAPAADAPGFQPDAISAALMIAASDPSSFTRWLPLRANPAADCVAPVVAR